MRSHLLGHEIGAGNARRYRHVLADLTGVSAAQLRDAALLTGLLIAAAGAAGFTMVAPPIVRALPNGAVDGILLLDGCHIALHAAPERELLLLDILAPSTHDPTKVVDVFTRRLAPLDVRSESHARG
ncbi:MAG: S-adenosylmethionine decarboxylase [Gemmatimonadota bacterium]|nr:S-adenosylmethionine decarboxylase [Gemmatimonadota bacterium]